MKKYVTLLIHKKEFIRMNKDKNLTVLSKNITQYVFRLYDI